MNWLVPYREDDPFREMDRMLGRMRGLISRSPLDWPDTDWSTSGVAGPALNLSEDEDAYHVEALVPGLKEDDIDVRVTGDVLTISGEVQHEHEDEGRRWHVVERRYGRFERSVRLPEGVKADDVEAELSDGVLNITLPKVKPGPVHQIEVKAHKMLEGNGSKK
jgi:HSP20 family protein